MSRRRELVREAPRHVIAAVTAAALRRPHPHPSHEAPPRAVRHRVSRACLRLSAVSGRPCPPANAPPCAPDGRLTTAHVWPAQRRQRARQAAGRRCWQGHRAAQPRAWRTARGPARLGSGRRCSSQARGPEPRHGRRRRTGRRAEGVCAAQAFVWVAQAGLRPCASAPPAALAGDVWVASQHAGWLCEAAPSVD